MKNRWFALVMTFLLALPILAGAAPAGCGEGADAHAVPILETFPADSAVTVRPDCEIQIRLDREHQNFARFREQLEDGRFKLTFSDGTHTFDADGPLEEAKYIPEEATVAWKPAMNLRRYTRYEVILALKAAANARETGSPGGAGTSHGTGNARGTESSPEGASNAWHTFSFTTGSDIGEPTRAEIALLNDRLPVSERAELTVATSDDYGLPASGARVNIGLVEDGQRLAGSATVAPGPGYTFDPKDEGRKAFTISNREAERVTARVCVTSPYGGDGGSQTVIGESVAVLAFEPGPAAAVSLDVDTAAAIAGSSVGVSGAVWDQYGNPCPELPVTLNILEQASGAVRSMTASTGSDGRYRAAFQVDRPQWAAVQAVVAGARSEQKAVLWQRCLAGNRQAFEVRAVADGEEASPAIPVSARAPRAISGRPGSAPPGYYIGVRCGGQDLGSGQAQADGSFSLATGRGFSADSVLTLTYSSEPPAPAVQVLTFSRDYGWGVPRDNLWATINVPVDGDVKFEFYETRNELYGKESLSFWLYRMPVGPSTPSYQWQQFSPEIRGYKPGVTRTMFMPAGYYKLYMTSSLGAVGARMVVTIPQQ